MNEHNDPAGRALSRRWCSTAVLVVVVALGLAMPAASAAPSDRAPQQALVLDDLDAAYELGDAAMMLFDEQGDLAIDDVVASERWVPVDAPRRTLRLAKGVLWLRVRMRDARPNARGGGAPDWRIEFSSPRPIELTVYAPDNDGRTSPWHGGLIAPPRERPVASRSVVYPIEFPSSSEGVWFLRLKTSPLGFAAVVVSAQASAARDAQERSLLGLYYGIALGLFIYNLFLLVALRDRTYLWYLVSLLMTVLFFLSRNGYLYLWGWTAGQGSGGGAPLALQLAGIVNFTRALLGTKKALPRVDRGLGVAVTVFVAAMAVALLAPTSWNEMALGPLAIPVILVALGTGVVRLVQGSVLARYYVVAWGFFLGGGVLFLAQSAGLVPHTVVTEYAMQVGSAAELVLLSLALAHRVRTLQQTADAAATEATVQRLAHARDLEQLRAAAASRLVEAQDDHSKRLARDLHDSVGHRFAEIALAADAARRTRTEDDSDDFDAIAALAREGAAETREIAHGLYPQRLVDLGLRGALRAAADLVERTGLHVVFDVDGDVVERVSPRRRLTALRVAEEALQNVVRHAEATTATIGLRVVDDGAVELVIVDDGRGFGNAARAGLGLRTMHDRATEAGATLVVDTAVQRGTTVRLTLPPEGALAPPSSSSLPSASSAPRAPAVDDAPASS